MQRANSLEKTLKLGKTEVYSRRRQQRIRWLDIITDLIDMDLSKLWEIVEDRGAWWVTVHGVAKSWARLSNWITTAIWQRFSSAQRLSRVQLCDPMGCTLPGLPVHHQLPELTQTHVHWVSDAIQPSHPLSSPSPPAFNISQLQCLFQWVSSSHQVGRALEFQLQHQSFQWTFRTELL